MLIDSIHKLFDEENHQEPGTGSKTGATRSHKASGKKDARESA